MNTNSMKRIQGLAAVGILAFAPSMASAFHGNIVNCVPTAGNKTTATVKPGLGCTNATNTIALKTSGGYVNGCSANAGVPWSTWGANKLAGKLTSTPTITNADVSLKALTFGSCNFSGDATSYTAGGALAFTLYSDAGITKVAKGKGFCNVAGDVPTQSALALCTITKGFLAAGKLETQIGLDLANPGNACELACNTGGSCPPAAPACTEIDLITTGSSHFRIDLPSNADCTGSHAPMYCCTGAGTGTC